MKIEKQYRLCAPLENVYSAWIASDTVIAPAKRLHIEPRVGGVFELYLDETASSPSIAGRFREVSPNARLKYSWQWSGGEEVTEVSVTFDPAEGCTLVGIEHVGFQSVESASLHDGGWDRYVRGLEQHLQSRQ